MSRKNRYQGIYGKSEGTLKRCCCISFKRTRAIYPKLGENDDSVLDEKIEGIENKKKEKEKVRDQVEGSGRNKGKRGKDLHKRRESRMYLTVSG